MENKDAQKYTDYEPTPAEAKLLEVLLEPENRFKSVTEKCQLAGISREKYYQAFAKPEFDALQKRLAAQVVSSHVLPATHALGKNASRGDNTAILTVLDMSGVYSPKQRVEHTGIGPVQFISADLSQLRAEVEPE